MNYDPELTQHFSRNVDEVTEERRNEPRAVQVGIKGRGS